MGFFDRLLNPRSTGTNSKTSQAKPAKKDESFFLDSDSSSSLGDLNYMREAKTIRRTFPGTADSPGNKELVTEVDAMALKVDTKTEGLGGEVAQDDKVSVTQGVPKPVKKTFAETMTQQELSQRLKGSALTGVNSPAAPDAAPVARKTELKQEETTSSSSKSQSSAPGSIDPFRAMVRDLNS